MKNETYTSGLLEGFGDSIFYDLVDGGYFVDKGIHKLGFVLNKYNDNYVEYAEYDGEAVIPYVADGEELYFGIEYSEFTALDEGYIVAMVQSDREEVHDFAKWILADLERALRRING